MRELAQTYPNLFQCEIFGEHMHIHHGSDDPDNVGHLGHFLMSIGSHPQAKLSGFLSCLLEYNSN